MLHAHTTFAGTFTSNEKACNSSFRPVHRPRKKQPPFTEKNTPVFDIEPTSATSQSSLNTLYCVVVDGTGNSQSISDELQQEAPEKWCWFIYIQPDAHQLWFSGSDCTLYSAVQKSVWFRFDQRPQKKGPKRLLWGFTFQIQVCFNGLVSRLFCQIWGLSSSMGKELNEISFKFLWQDWSEGERNLVCVALCTDTRQTKWFTRKDFPCSLHIHCIFSFYSQHCWGFRLHLHLWRHFYHHLWPIFCWNIFFS